MAAGVQLPDPNETIDLQQQVARLQALLEASRQVHSTIREEEVLESVLRIAVRELEMAGAAFPGTGLAYGDGVPAAEQSAEDGASGEATGKTPAFPLHDREGKPMTELLVAPPEGRELVGFAFDHCRLDAPLRDACLDLVGEAGHRRQKDLERAAVPICEQRQGFAEGLRQPIDLPLAAPRQNEEHPP